MLYYLMAVDFILKRWKRNPSASKMDIGVWSHWRKDTEENRLPLSPTEVEDVKKFLKEYGPISYKRLFRD